MRDNKRGELPSLSAFLIGRKYKESGECFSPASAGGKRSRVYLYGLLRIWNLLYKGVKVDEIERVQKTGLEPSDF